MSASRISSDHAEYRQTSNKLHGKYNATRFPQKPMAQPAYSFAHVAKPEKDLAGSTLQYVTNREHFQACMAEMLLLCKEAVRRRKTKITGSKPLSLEYIADRLDIDDPCFGFLIRTEENRQQHANWKKGMLQGFVTITTFTNWQTTFRWDSRKEAAFELDDDDLRVQMVSGERRWDEDGNLARDLQSTVRMGDIWNEGIVWPRIAEISLLGGLGCGKALISLAIEHLEHMKANEKCNYDYVVLQATDNSVSFYEAMGFVRVGAVVRDLPEKSDSESGDDEVAAVPLEAESPQKPDALALPDGMSSSELTSYTTKKAGEYVSDIAKRLKVDVWDVIFLNKGLYPELTPSSKLRTGTMLHIPVKSKPETCDRSLKRPLSPGSEETQWYIAKENDTPRMIARMFGVKCLELVEANKIRLPGLMSNSRLKKGTRVRVSHFDVEEFAYRPYVHWSFPDDDFEEGEPSYMMARRLNRKTVGASRERSVESSLAVKISQYEPTTLLIPPPPEPEPQLSAKKPTSALKRKRTDLSNMSGPPKRPPSAFMLFATDQRKKRPEEFEGVPFAVAAKLFSQEWSNLDPESKAPYERKYHVLLDKYKEDKVHYQTNMSSTQYSTESSESSDDASDCRSSVEMDGTAHLFNKVVRLKPGTETETPEIDYKYWYVLTFIPDLQWCHLAPLKQVGVFGPEKPRAEGRPKWMLVDEDLGHELDVSSSACIPVPSKSMRRTVDADKEEWDITDDGSDYAGTSFISRSSGSASNTEDSSSHGSAKNARSKKRKISPKKEPTSLCAIIPESGKLVSVRLVGTCAQYHGAEVLGKRAPNQKSSSAILESVPEPPVPRKRGRPKGSKNRKSIGTESSSSNSTSALSSGILGGSKKVGWPAKVKSTPRTDSRSNSSCTPPSGRDSSVCSASPPRNERQRSRQQSLLKDMKLDNQLIAIPVHARFLRSTVSGLHGLVDDSIVFGKAAVTSNKRKVESLEDERQLVATVVGSNGSKQIRIVGSRLTENVDTNTNSHCGGQLRSKHDLDLSSAFTISDGFAEATSTNERERQSQGEARRKSPRNASLISKLNDASAPEATVPKSFRLQSQRSSSSSQTRDRGSSFLDQSPPRTTGGRRSCSQLKPELKKPPRKVLTPPRKRGRPRGAKLTSGCCFDASSVGSNASDSVDSEVSSKSPQSGTPASCRRPRRSAAPSYLGESPSTPSSSTRLKSKRVARVSPWRQSRSRIHATESTVRNYTTSAPGSLLGGTPRKRRRVNSAGSCRSTLQN